jgi:hypothetical protein
MARGAGTALYQGKPPRVVLVRFDAMRGIWLPEPREDWVEVEPGVTWWALEEQLGERGMGPRVYPTSAPRSTVGGWLAENGVGVGSYEYGWLLQNVLRVEVVLAGGKRDLIEGEPLRHLVGSRERLPGGARCRSLLSNRPGEAKVSWTCRPPRTSSWCGWPEAPGCPSEGKQADGRMVPQAKFGSSGGFSCVSLKPHARHRRCLLATEATKE